MKLNPEHIGPRLKALLKTLDMTQAELAERCGVTQGGISQILNSERTPSLDVLCRILEVIPVKFEMLAHQPEEMKRHG